ncbi:MAG: TetR/AcrR family transcriptional regulator [Bifidobacterium sp.]|nr:TetR/AcrR family transcriptional regulator [Bifidobacterium sp.]
MGEAQGRGRGRAQLRDAFWRLLAQRRYSAINVRDVARVAGVNKNTFYYHYANLDELAAEAIDEELPYEFAVIILSRLLTPEGEEADTAQAMPEPSAYGGRAPSAALGGDDNGHGLTFDQEDFARKLSRLKLLTGLHSAPVLQAMMKETLVGAWCNMLDLDPAQFGDESWLAIDFMYGGITGMLMHCADGTDGATALGALTQTSFFRRLSRTMPRVVFGTLADDGVTLSTILDTVVREEER